MVAVRFFIGKFCQRMFGMGTENGVWVMGVLEKRSI